MAAIFQFDSTCFNNLFFGPKAFPITSWLPDFFTLSTGWYVTKTLGPRSWEGWHRLQLGQLVLPFSFSAQDDVVMSAPFVGFLLVY